MPLTHTIRTAAGWLLLAALLLGCGAAAGPQIRAEGAWARPSMAAAEGGMGAVAGAFMRLSNDGAAADRLVGASTQVAGAVEIHETIVQDDVAVMRPLPGGLELPAGGSVELKPGSYHLMLVDLKRDLAAGDTFDLELRFERGGSLAVRVEVRMP